MTALDTKFYLLRNGQGRIEASTHPDTGKRRFYCHGCEASGDGEGQEHFYDGCGQYGRHLPRNHFS